MITDNDGGIRLLDGAIVPANMQAVHAPQPGGPEQLVAGQHDVPVPDDEDVLIAVAYAGVNRPDIIQRMGFYPPPPGAPDILGLEVSGTVIAAGKNVPAEMLGQKVCALVSGGGYAQYCCADHRHCLPVPDNMTLQQAAAMPETLFTVWHNLFERAYAGEGESVLVHGGTSGIGMMAITLAKLFGLTIYVTCGSDAKCAAALDAGADAAINYKTQDFVAEIAALTSGTGVNIVLDMVAGDYVPRNMQCLAADGRHVTIAVQGGLKADISMIDIMQKRLVLTGSTLRPRDNEFKALLAHEIYDVAWPLAAQGKLLPVIDSVYPLAKAADAHAHMEAGAHIGKIILQAAQ